MSHNTPRRRRVSQAAVASIAVAAIALPTLGAASPALASSGPAGQQPHVTAQNDRGSHQTDSNTSYSVSIQGNSPYQSDTPPTFTVNVQGYTKDNWINLWYRKADSSGHPIGRNQSLGGTTSSGSGSNTVTANQPLPAGNYVIQASVGKYPNEAWSQNLPITVNPSKPSATNFGAHLVNKSSGDFPAFAIYLNDNIVVHNLPKGTQVTITFSGSLYSGTLTGTVGEAGVLNVSGQEVFKPVVGVPKGTVTMSAPGVGTFASGTY